MQIYADPTLTTYVLKFKYANECQTRRCSVYCYRRKNITRVLAVLIDMLKNNLLSWLPHMVTIVTVAMQIFLTPFNVAR